MLGGIEMKNREKFIDEIAEALGYTVHIEVGEGAE